MAAARRTEGQSLVLPLVVGAIAALLPAAFAVSRVVNVPTAARDAGLVHVVGLEPQVWHALDAVVGALLQAAPVGTRAARAAAGGAIVLAATGAALYAIVRALLEGCAPTRRLGAVVAAVAAVLPLVGAPWQIESSAIGGAAVGGLLVVLPVYVLGARPRPVDLGAARGAVFVLGLAAGYDPFVGVCALAGAVALGAADADLRRIVLGGGRHALSLGVAFAAGLAPTAFAVARVRGAGVPLGRALTQGLVSDSLAAVARGGFGVVWGELGSAVLLFAVAGVVLAAVTARARPLAAGLLAVAIAGTVVSRRLPCGPSAYAGPLLAALAATCALAGAGMQALVRVVATARVPMARASAAMVLVLELVVPVDAADEALARPAAAGGVAAWDDAAWGELPPSAVVLLPSDATWRRAEVARARGSLRGDVTVIPSVAPGASPAARRALASDPALLPLWRDLEIGGLPSESSLAAVAATRPLATVYEPRWGRALGGHLVPDGLFDRFELEPRGASDRRAGLAAFEPLRARLAPRVHADAEIAGETARLLRARALLVATLDPRDADAVAGSVADVRAFAPDDAVAAEIVARVAGKGPLHLDDLRP